jgi:gluconolactonase
MTTALCLILATLAADGLIAGPIQTVSEGYQFTEGPVWLPEGLRAGEKSIEGPDVLLSDVPAGIIYRSDQSVFRKPSGNSNGLALDLEGRLLACEHGNRRVSLTHTDGTVVALADAYDGKKFNSPNDLVVHSSGAVFCTDPTYGLAGREQELPFKGVYAIAPGGEVRLMTDSFNMPNGIALAPDEQTLYVADSAEGHIRAFPLEDDLSLGEGRLFGELPVPDGMAVDTEGRVWCASSEGVVVFTPEGERVGVVEFPQNPANCAFGGANRSELYVTARTALYKVKTTATGLPAPAYRD